MHVTDPQQAQYGPQLIRCSHMQHLRSSTDRLLASLLRISPKPRLFTTGVRLILFEAQLNSLRPSTILSYQLILGLLPLSPSWARFTYSPPTSFPSRTTLIGSLHIPLLYSPR